MAEERIVVKESSAINSKDRLRLYRELVLRWNRRVPLVSRRTTESSIRRLISHSLQAERILPTGVKVLIDVGSGAGFPGVPIGIARPLLEVRLVERGVKKQLFLREAIRKLGLTNVDLLAQSFEAGMLKGEHPLAITALGLGGYKKLAQVVSPRLDSGDGLLLFVSRELAQELAGVVGAAWLDWSLLEGSRKAGVCWLEKR